MPDQITTSMENPLERILVIGKHERDVDLFDSTVRMKVLNSGEQREVYEYTSNFDALTRLRAVQHETLGRAIVAINGQALTYKPKKDEEVVSKRKIINQSIELLKQSPQGVIDFLYKKYEELIKEQNDIIEDLKKKSTSPGQEESGRSAED